MMIKPPDFIVKNHKESSPQLSNNEHSLVLHKKRQYKTFLVILKANKFVTATMVAQVLGVSRNTISEWLRTPKAIKIITEEIDYHVNKIKEANDWHSSAYLLDKLTKEDNHTASPSSLVQVNNVILEDKAKYNI